MGRDLILLLAGAFVALGSSLITILVQHQLALRAEKIKRRLDAEEKLAEENRARLLKGTDIHLALIEKKLKASIGLALDNIASGISSAKDLEDAMEVIREIRERKSENVNNIQVPLLPPVSKKE